MGWQNDRVQVLTLVRNVLQRIRFLSFLVTLNTQAFLYLHVRLFSVQKWLSSAWIRGDEEARCLCRGGKRGAFFLKRSHRGAWRSLY